MSLARGAILPSVLKSALRSICMPPMLRIGSRIIAISTTPMPPTQETMPRQSSAPRGSASSPTITVPPVVVIAEVNSK